MRITLEIDDALMREVLRLTGLKSRKEAVDMGLRTLLLRLRNQEALRHLRGQLRWEGDLNAMRLEDGRASRESAQADPNGFSGAPIDTERVRPTHVRKDGQTKCDDGGCAQTSKIDLNHTHPGRGLHLSRPDI